MKRLCIIAIGACALALLLPTSALADKASGKKAKLIAKYDKNKNGVIDGDEKEALRKDFAADPKGELKAYDKDGDGKLSDEEIAAIKPGSGKAKEGSTKTKQKGSEKAKSSEDGAAKTDK